MDLYSHNLKLVTFHHVLHDQLMPWLPEQQSPAFYKAWEQYVHEHKEPYLMLLLKVYSRNHRKLSPELKAEWEAVSRVRLKPEIKELIQQMKTQQLTELKLFYYRELLSFSFGYCLSYFEGYVEQLSEERKQFELRKLMRKLDDLYASSRALFKAKNSEDAVVVYLVHLFVVLFRERLVVRYHQILFKGTVLLSKDLLRPDSLKDYPMYRLLNSLYENFSKKYMVLLLPKQKSTAQEMLHNELYETYSNQLQAQEGFVSEPQTDLIAERDSGGQTKNSPEDHHAEDGMKPLLSTAEAAKLLGISENGLRKRAKAGKIPYVFVFNKYRFKPVDLKAFISDNTINKETDEE